jgi:itaconate CoA-transferase
MVAPPAVAARRAAAVLSSSSRAAAAAAAAGGGGGGYRRRLSTAAAAAGRAPPLPLQGKLVVSMEQAVAAPYCTSRLADAGARVIKIERPEGDFARGYDKFAHGLSSYFVWLNRGKESLVANIKDEHDRELLYTILGQADVFVQNLAPGAAARSGLGSAELRERFPRLVCVDISGYGEGNDYSHMKAYDLLVQAEAGLSSVTGQAGGTVGGRVGVSICDIGCGMHCYSAVLEALMARELVS